MNKTVTIKIKGIIDSQWQVCFQGMQISHERDNSIIHGSVLDDAQLYGIIDKMRDLNLSIISLSTGTGDA